MSDPTVEELQAQIAALQQQLAIVQAGSGPLATGNQNATAINGGKAVSIEGNINGGIHFGDSTREIEVKRTLRDYLSLLESRYGSLPSFVRLSSKGADARHPDRQPPRIAEIFVALDVTAPTTREKTRRPTGLAAENSPEHRVPLVREIAANRQVVITGEPGSGKSTLARHLCWSIAAGDQRGLADWPAGNRPVLPVYVNLRDLARFAPPMTRPPSQSPADRQAAQIDAVWRCLEDRWNKDKLPLMREVVEHIASDPATPMPLFLFDGLDEVDLDQRKDVACCIREWSACQPQVRVVVTCRSGSYRPESSWRLPYPIREIKPFTLEEQVPRFVRGWFTELGASGWLTKSPSDLAKGLLEAIKNRPELSDLAPRPLMLTMMSLVHERDENLPPGKALLYNRLVDLLLWEWEFHRECEVGRDESTGLAGLLRLTADPQGRAAATETEIKRALAGLVYRRFEAVAAAGRRNREDTLVITGSSLLEALKPLHPGDDEERRVWAERVVGLIRRSSGLIREEDDSRFTFPHKTLAEFLGAFWLCEYQTDKAVAFMGFSKTPKLWDDWRELGLLAAGFKARTAKGDEVLPWLHDHVPSPPNAEKDASPNIIVAAEMLHEIGGRTVSTTPYGRQLWENTTLTLRHITEKEWLLPPIRARAAACLGRMGDQRPGVSLTTDGLPDIAWSEVIEPGPFPMGNDKKHGGDQDERPRHDCLAITEPFIISRYPITVTQYGSFVRDCGYLDDRWWLDPDAREWRKKHEITGPEDLPEIFEIPNHPQVGISWFEAKAFCAWLTEKMGKPIRLPSEAEWERAARHTDARTFPWGEDNPERHANIAKTGIGSTSAVGIFPSGGAVCGALDMAGNVWEWTRTPLMANYQPQVYQPLLESAGSSVRILRGGSFDRPSHDARCAYRDRDVPGDRVICLGFRVASSPF